MKTVKGITKLLALTIVIGCSGALIAQSPPPPQQSLPQQSPEQPKATEKGFTLYERFSGSSNADGQVMLLTNTFGYNFSKLFGVDIGIPVYFVQPTSSIRGTTSTASLGNIYADLRMTLANPLINSSSTFTAMAPTGDKSSGLSTGRATFEWDNRFEHEFKWVTPFIDVSVANAVVDRRYLQRPYTALGKMAHFEGGLQWGLGHSVTLSASPYADVPWGQQKVISRLILAPSRTTPLLPAGTTPTDLRKGGFEIRNLTVGDAGLTRDNGYSASLGASLANLLDLEIGYTRSVPFRLDTLTWGIGFNLTPLFRTVRH